MNCQAKRYATTVACPAGHLTADKRKIKDFPQIAFGNFFYPQIVICSLRAGKK